MRQASNPLSADIAKITHLTKYAWWLEDKKRRETYDETCERVVNYNLSLYQGPATQLELETERQLMYKKMYALETLPAGRTMRIGGTPACYKFPEMNFNCSFAVIKSIQAFIDCFHLALCSVGTGYRVLIKDVAQLHLMAEDIILEHENYKTKYPNSDDKTYREELGYQGHYELVKITIGDSKEGWVKALEWFLLHCCWNSKVKFIINYDNIRPAGKRIKTAGGFAAGYQGMQDMFSALAEIITLKEGQLDPVAAMDLQNIEGKNVVTGGNRRAAQIAFGSPEDEAFISAKYNLYTQTPEGEWIIDPKLEHRKMSNNSVVFESKPSYEQLSNIFEKIKNNGEPGFFNLEAARKRRPNCEGGNPCMEILLDDKGVCNLSTVVMTNHLENIGKYTYFDLNKLEESVRLATRIGMRMTNVTLSLPEWDEVQKRDRLTGVSFTGWMDAVREIKFIDIINVNNYLFNVLVAMNRWANEEADSYAYEMRIPRPLLVTCIKPEGTMSQLAGAVSPGLHNTFAPYYIRRMSMSKTDPLNITLKFLGVPWEEDQSQKESTRDKFLFPIKTTAKESAYDEPALSQLGRYLQMQKLYTDHNSSCTIYVGEDEWLDVINFVFNNWDDFVAVSFLPKHPCFPQMPYEEISKEKYEEMIKTFPDLENLNEVLTYFEKEQTDYVEDSDACFAGVCPSA